MVEVKITTMRKLDTSDEIAAFLQEENASMLERAIFRPGDVVTIARTGLPPEMAIGDVALVLFDEAAPSPFTTVRLMHASGAVMNFQAQTSNLSKREGATS